MNYLLIRHNVTDFGKWKSAYDAHAGARTAAGLKEERLLRNIDQSQRSYAALFGARFEQGEAVCRLGRSAGENERRWSNG